MEIKQKVLLEDHFKVLNIDKEGKKFEKCSRIEA